MILLDTTVVSEILKPFPSAIVLAWIESHFAEGLFLSTVSEAELRFGIAILPEGRRRTQLQIAVDRVLAEDFEGKCLSFDRAAAAQYGTVSIARRKAGRPISAFDAQIAAIALAQGMQLATRNLRDFEGTGVALLDPWAA